MRTDSPSLFWKLAGLIAIASTAFAASPASAQSKAPGGGDPYYFETSFTPVLTESNESGSFGGGSVTGVGAPPDSVFGYDVRLLPGYVFWNHMLVGAQINIYSLGSKRSPSTLLEGSTKSTTKMEYGFSLGYVIGGFRFVASYILNSTKTLSVVNEDSSGTKTGDNKVTNSGGSGYQITIGYSYPLLSWLQIGPTAVYRDVAYTKQALDNNIDPTQSYPAKSFTTNAVEKGLVGLLSFTARF